MEQCRRVGVDPTGPPQAPAAPAAAAAAAAGGDPGGDGDRQLAAKRLQQAAGAAVAAVLPEVIFLGKPALVSPPPCPLPLSI